MHADDLVPLDFHDPRQKALSYESLRKQAQALFDGERDWLANMAQFSAFIFQQLPQLNWAGFYLYKQGELILGPFQGKVACVRIPLDRGVCGACARSQQAQIVTDVHAFPGHIACDAASQSELVLPVMVHGQLWAVFDMDAPVPARFDQTDADGVSTLLAILVDASDFPEIGS